MERIVQMQNNRENEWVVLKISNQWPSKITSGKCVTLVARNMKSHQTFKTWPDTTFKSWSWWRQLKEGDIFTNVGIYNVQKRILSSTNFPKVTGHLDLKTGEVIEKGPLPGQQSLL